MREYGAIERKRIREGVTPDEYKRWLELEQLLTKQILNGTGPDGIERRRHLRVPTRMLVQFRTRDELKDAVISKLSRGGLFISTSLAAEIGSQFMLCIRVDETGEAVDVPCEIVSSNMGVDLSATEDGMGLKFMRLNAGQREAVDKLMAAALDHEQLEEFWEIENSSDKSRS